MSPCGQVYVPNSWQMTPRLGNLRSEKPGPLSFESFSSEYCSEHGLRAEVSARVLLCRTQKSSGQWNVVLCCKRRDALFCLRNHLPQLTSSCSSTIYHVPSHHTSRLVTKLKAPCRSRRTMYFTVTKDMAVKSCRRLPTFTHDSTLRTNYGLRWLVAFSQA
jgi:hypothetical protein